MPKLQKKGSVASFNDQFLQAKQRATCGLRMDTSLDILEESRFKKKNVELIRKLSKELRFTYDEVEAIALIYYKIQKEAGNPQGQMTRNQLREVLHKAFDMTDSEITDFVVYILDMTPSQNISMEAWAKSMSLFIRGTIEEKIEHCFNVYDMFGKGIILRDKMLYLMRHCVLGEDDSEDVIKDFFEIISNKLDKNRDGKITFEDFQQTVKEDPLMMEVFGQCLPSRLAVHAVRTTFTNYSGKHY